MAVVASWDFPNRRIYMSTAEWHPYDIYVEYRAYRRLNESARPFNRLLKMDGNIPKGGGKATPRYMVLLEGTKIVPVDGSIAPVTNITGEVFADDQTDFIDIVGLTVAPRINYTPPSAEIIIQLAQAAQLEQASFEGQVTVDQVSGYAGVGYVPDSTNLIGTYTFPSSNITDMKTIGTTRGIDEFFMIGNFAVGATDSVNNLHFYGQGSSYNVARTLVTYVEGCTTSSSHWHEAQITGYQGGESFYHDCMIDGLENAHCLYKNCGIKDGTSRGWSIRQRVMASGHSSHFENCSSDEGTAIIDRSDRDGTGTSATLHFKNWSGQIKFIRNTTASKIYIHMNGGTCTVDSTCTAGELYLSGFGNIVNETGGMQVFTASFVSQSFYQLELIVESLRNTHQGFGARWFVDPINGSDLAPGNSPAAPVATITKAVELAVSGRGDIIFLLAPGAGPAILDERVVINKEDVHLRGPGRGFEIKPSTTSAEPVIKITANNCSVSSLVVRSASGELVGNVVEVEGKFSKLTKIYVVGAGQGVGAGHGIVYKAGDYHEAIDCESEKCGGDALILDDMAHPTNGSPREVSIKGGNYYLCKNGIGFKGQGTVGSSNRINRILGANIHDNLEYGISIDALTSGTLIDSNTLIHDSGLGPVNDNGLDTHWGGAERQAETAIAVWGADATTNNTTGTMGNKLNSASAGGVDYDALATAVWTRPIEATFTAEQILKIAAAVLAGKVSGAGTGTESFTGLDGSTIRVISNSDQDGNRTGVTLDGA